MLGRKWLVLPAGALVMLFLGTVLSAERPVLQAADGTPAIYLPFVARKAGPPPTRTPTATASSTPTITATPTPQFYGVVPIYPPINVDGWGWPSYAVVAVQVTAPDGSAVDAITITTEADGHLPWTNFHRRVEEGHWVTITVGSAATGFPVAMVRATADPG